MLFNQSKCKCLHIGRANGKEPYEMHNTVLLKTSKEKDLGMTISADWKVSGQCGIAARKGNQLLGMIKRNITYREKNLKLSAQRFRYALFAFIHTQTYFEYYTLTLRLASLVKKAVIYAYWTKELFDICRENVSYMATLPSVARHVIHADNLRPRH